ncbi:MAG: TonB-dependent receptor [Bacteroidales bacterium]|nr:TonB-dependent receptor [Bacteroidales bacterium]
MKKTFTLIFLITITLSGFTQNGIIRGKITDAETGGELIGASVLIQGTYQGSSADLDGNYAIEPVASGTYSLRCSFISYETQNITGVQLAEGEVRVINFQLSPSSIGLQEVVVEAKAIRNTESSLLTMQKKSASLTNGISAQQIARSGDSDAAGAVKRISGVSVEGGKYVYVRGLGDRYSKTTLNGCEIPGLDPERNTVQMDIFPTSAIENMVVYKSFSARLNPFTGGLIDIVTRDFPEKFFVSFSASFEYNTLSSFNSDFLSYSGGKYDGIGFDDGSRDFPVQPTDIPNYPSDRDAIDQLTKKFNKVMDVEKQPSLMNQQYSFAVGNLTTLFGKQFGFNFGLNYKKDNYYFSNGQRGIFQLTDPDAGNLNTEQIYNETAGLTETLIGGLANLNLKLNADNRIGYVLLVNHSGVKTAYYRDGQKPSDEIGMYIQSRELGFQERSIIANQIKGRHFFNSFFKLGMEWISSLTVSSLDEPDLRFFTNSFYPDLNGDARYEINPSKYKVPSRYKRGMRELNLDNKVDFTLPFQFNNAPSKLRFGLAFVLKKREFTEEKIDYLAQVQYYNGNVSDYLDDANIGQNHPLYDPLTRQNYGLYVQNSTDLRNSYDAAQSIFAAYVSADVRLAPGLRLEAGVRFEKNRMEVGSRKKGIDKGSLDDADFLPAINLTYTLAENMNLRFAYTRTLSRPSFREIAPFASFSPVAPTIVGNPDLRRTLIDNIDLRWEYFMKPGELVSFSLFYKSFKDPIEMVDNPLAANPEISYQNVDRARNYGFEFEIRKSLDFINALRNLKIGINFSYVESEVSIDANELESIRALVPDYPDTRPLFGQSPYIFNTILGYDSKPLGLSANLVFNVIGERIVLVTKGGTPDIIEQPFPQLDFNIQKTVGKHLTLSLKAKNLLNSAHNEVYEFEGKVYPYYTYSVGQFFGFGVSYNLN